MRLAISILLTGGVLLACLVRIIWLALEPVTRRRVERFAERQQLRITADNGSLVIAYLATTRRWRVAGLVTGFVGSSLYAIVGGTVALHEMWLFAGWFVGAVVAEWRINAHNGPRRAALLVPRRLADYLPTPVRWLTAGAVVSTVVVGVIAIVRAPASHAAFHAERRDHSTAGAWDTLPPFIFLILALLVVAAVWIVRRRVLSRRRPVAGADVLAADDAIRARSLRVLSGATVALMGYLAAPLIIFANNRSAAAALPSFAVVILAPVLGWNIATWSIAAAPTLTHLARADAATRQ